MSKVKRITVSNLKAISELSADFNGCTAIITGGNNKGKSSFLRSIQDRMRQVKPDVILKDGESDGRAEMELTTGERFVWEFNNRTKSGEKLTFITKDAIKTSVTRDIANRFFPKTLDIDKFLNDSPKAQRETLQNIVGIDFSELDAAYKKAYDDRTYANRAAETAKAKLTDVSDDIGPKVDILQLQSEMAGIDSHNDKYDYVSNGVETKKRSVEHSKSEIERLQKLIDQEKESIEKLNAEIKSGESWLKDKKNQKKDDADKKELGDKISKAVAHNESVDANERAKQGHAEYEKLKSDAIKADKAVKAIEKKRNDLIRSARLPDGFGFSDSGITYNGHAFSKEQLSSSAIYVAALKLASMNIGEVKTLHFDASFLDKNSLKDIESWAKENDLQLLIERPDFDGGEIEYQIMS